MNRARQIDRRPVTKTVVLAAYLLQVVIPLLRDEEYPAACPAFYDSFI